MIEGAGMVIVKMGDDHIIDVVGAQPKRANGLQRMAQYRPPATLGLLGVIAGIDKNRPPFGFQHPDKIVHGMWKMVQRVEHEAFKPGPVVPVSIFDSIDFPQ